MAQDVFTKPGKILQRYIFLHARRMPTGKSTGYAGISCEGVQLYLMAGERINLCCLHAYRIGIIRRETETELIKGERTGALFIGRHAEQWCSGEKQTRVLNWQKLVWSFFERYCHRVSRRRPQDRSSASTQGLINGEKAVGGANRRKQLTFLKP